MSTNPQDRQGSALEQWGYWRPIKTAPRDGQHILAMKAGTSFGYMYGQPLPEVQTVVHWFPDPDEPGFYTSVGEVEPEHPFEATHWQPLSRLYTRQGSR